MRQATGGKYPRWAIMENVAGIYSARSKKAGAKSDFGVVLNELCKLKDKAFHVPEPESGGKTSVQRWLTAGAVVGDGFSLAWRTLCASQFNLAQRRKRMFLVVSFDDERAAQILSEQEGERRDFTPGYLKGENAAGSPAAGIGSVGFEPGILARDGGHVWDESVGCIRADMGDNQTAVAVYDARGNGDGQTANAITGDHNGHISDYTALAVVPYSICSMSSNAMMSSNPESGVYEAETSRTIDGNGGNPSVRQGGMVVAIQGNAIGRKPENGPAGAGYREDVSYSLTAVDREAVCYQELVGTLAASDHKFPQNQQIAEGKAIVEREGARYTARRLMPAECLLLQGLPAGHLDNIHISEPTEADIDYWQDVWAENRAALGKPGKPKSRKQVAKWLTDPYTEMNAYKAIGNSLAVPCALYVMRGIVT
jgi:DNA (cytosine-5)-methyltransferase 1